MRYIALMSPDPSTSFRIDPQTMAGLYQVKERDGIPLSEQVRRALRMWLEAKGVEIGTAASERRSGPQAKNRVRRR